MTRIVKYGCRILGYSLMELSIVMSIVAILAAGGLVVVSSQDESNRLRITLERLSMIEQSIQGFVSANGFLPCPANGNLAENNTDYGKPLYNADGTCTIEVGMLPIRNNDTRVGLNIHEEIALDGWNRRFRYQIADGFYDEENFENDENRGDLSVQDIRGHEKTNLNLKEPLNYGAAYVVLSHGPNGYGALLKTGDQVTASSETRERENSDDDTAYVQNEKTSVFDDILVFKRKIDLVPPKLQYANLVTPDADCHHAGAIAKNGKPGSGGILDTLSDAGYETLVDQIYKSAIALKKVCDNPPASAFNTNLICIDSTFGEIVAETKANTTTAKSQDSPAVAALRDGKFVIVWQSADEDGSGYGIFGQLINADGTFYETPFQINSETLNNQSQPFVLTTNFGFIVAWSSNFYGDESFIAMQRFFSSGAKYGTEYRLETPPSVLSQEPYLLGFDNNTYLLLFQGIHTDDDAYIYQQLYTHAGYTTGDVSPVNTTTTGSQTEPAGAVKDDGGYVVVWESYDTTASPNNYNILSRRFDSSMTALDVSDVMVHASDTTDQRYPEISKLAGGGFVVVWQSDGEIMAKLYNSSFTAIGAEFQVNTTTSGSQEQPSVAGLNDGGFVVTWSSSGQDGSNYGIYQRRYDSTGTAESTEFLTNTTTSNAQHISKVANYLYLVDYITAWQSYNQDTDSWGIYFKLFADGSSC